MFSVSMNNSQGNDDCVEIDGKDVWPDAVELELISLMVEEVKKGNRTTTTFSKTGWKTIQKGLQDKFKKSWTTLQLKNKYNQLRQRQRRCKAILNETGVGYVAATGKLDATQEVWDRVKAVHSQMYSRFKNQGCPEYPDLCYIIGDTAATGAYARPSTQSTSTDSLEMRDEDIDADVVEIDSARDGDEVMEKGKDGDEVKENSKGTKKTKKAKMNSSTAIEHTLAVMAENSKERNEMLNERLATSSALAAAKTEALIRNTDTSAIIECMNIMQEMDIDGVEFTKGLDRLHAMPVFQQLFLKMNDESRRKWLKSLSTV
ncbi:L10-interacting MYB domain-containing protein [Linum perenne]